jgi:hypothetical protein
MTKELPFPSWWSQATLLSSTVFRQTLEHTQPIQSVILRVLSWYGGIKLLRHEGDHSPPSSAEVKNEWSCTSIPPCIFRVCTGTTLLLFKWKWIVYCSYEKQQLFIMNHEKTSPFYVHILQSETSIHSKQLPQLLECACGCDREEGQNLLKTQM